VSEEISVMSRCVLSVRKANSDFDRRGHLASVYSFQGTDCRDGNVLKPVKSVGTVEMHAYSWRHLHMWYPDGGICSTLIWAYVLP
jgi:hypothetical protein